MKPNSSTDTQAFVHKPRILFVARNERVRYLIDELRNKVDIIDVFNAKIRWREPYFLMNRLLCALEIACNGMKKGEFVKVSHRTLSKNSIRRPAVMKRISSEIERHVNSLAVKPDLILQQSSMFAPYTEIPRIPFILIIDNYPDPPNSSIQKDKSIGWETIYDEDFHKFHQELYSKAAYIFTLSEWCKRGLSKEYDIEPKKIFAIGWGPGRARPAKEIDMDILPEKDHKSILAVGNDYTRKGFDILLKSAEHLKDFSITIAGKYNTIENIHVPKNVEIKGYVSDESTLINLYTKSELFFLFSKFDASPHVLWEAQAYGCVIIGYDAYGISEAVINNKTGILLKTRNPILVAEEIRKLYRDKDRLERMQKAAIKNYSKNGTWNRVSQKIAETLTSMRVRPHENSKKRL